MLRSIKSRLTAVLSLALVALVAVVAPSSALAKKPPVFPKKYPHKYHHYHHPHFHGGVDVAIGGAGYIVADPLVNPLVNPVVSPMASQEVYTLYYKDAQKQAHVYGEFVATSYGSGVTDWGGLVEARDKLTASGLESWVRAGHAAAPDASAPMAPDE